MTVEPYVVPPNVDFRAAIHAMKKFVDIGQQDHAVRFTKTDGDYELTAEKAWPLLAKGFQMDIRNRLASVEAQLRHASDLVKTHEGEFVFGNSGILDQTYHELDRLKIDIVFLDENDGGLVAITPEIANAVTRLDALAYDIRKASRAQGEESAGGGKTDARWTSAAKPIVSMQDVEEEARAVLGNKSISRMVLEVVEQMHPALLKKFYPRIYENTGGYFSPKEAAAHLAYVVAEAMRFGFHNSPTAYRLIMPSLQYMAERRMPSFFLAPDLTKAIMATDIHGDINWVELKLPYEHGIFMLPKGTLIHPTDGDVALILWTRVHPGVYPPPAPGLPPMNLTNTALALVALCPDRAIWYDSTVSATFRPTIQVRNLFYRNAGDPVPAQLKNVPYLDQDLTEEDQEFLEKIGALAFGTFMILNARPDLRDDGSLIRKVKKHDEVKEFWSPNILGKKYKIKREIPTIGKDGTFNHHRRKGEGAHASPRMHWRRGHTRQQPCGKGRKERKEIWIEPMVINLTLEDE